jgi:hypothetical protein
MLDFKYKNESDFPLIVWIEPWCEEFRLDVNETILITNLKYSVDMNLDLDLKELVISVYDRNYKFAVEIIKA